MLAQTRGYPEVGSVFVTDTGLRLVLRAGPMTGTG